MNKNKSKYLWNVGAGLVFILTSIFLFWKCKYGFVHMDEAFYLTVPYRLFQGDALFWDEWAPSQMSGFVTYPVVAAFIRITGGTTGIYLYVRYLYVVCKMMIAVYMYYVLKKADRVGAAFSAFIFLIFAEYGMHVLSYNSIAIGGMVVCLLLLWDCEKSTKIKCILAGIALSVSVLAMPSLVFLYLLYGITVLLYGLVRKKKEMEQIHTLLTWKAFWFLTIGAGIMAVCFFGFVFARISPNQLVASIPELMSDPEHQSKKIWKIVPGYFARIVIGNDHNWYTLVVYGLFAVTFVWVLISRKRNKDRRKLQYSIVIALAILLLLTYCLTNPYINHTIFVVHVAAFFSPFLSKRTDVRKAFCFLYLPGMAFTFCEYIVSNTGFSGISGASCAALAGSCLMLIMVCRELSGRWEQSGKQFNLNAPNVFTCLLVLVFVITLSYQRYNYIFWEGPMSEQTQLLTEGPQAGILVSEDRERTYLAEMEDMEVITQESKGMWFLNLNDESLFLASDMRFAIYSAHPFGISKSRDILYRYYEVHPHRVPDAVYLSMQEEAIASELCERLDMERSNLGQAGIILFRK